MIQLTCISSVLRILLRQWEIRSILPPSDTLWGNAAHGNEQRIHMPRPGRLEVDRYSYYSAQCKECH